MVEIPQPRPTCSYQVVDPIAKPLAPEPPLTLDNIRLLFVYVKACERCLKGKRDCMVDKQGSACAGCKARKYGCDHTGQFDVLVMRVMRPISGSESESEVEVVAVERKGKEQQGNPPVQVKKEKRPREEEDEEIAKPKAKPRKAKAKAVVPGGKKGKGKEPSGSKGAEIELDHDGTNLMEVDGSDNKLKRSRSMAWKVSPASVFPLSTH
jgi:hypothetical protein